MIAIGEGLPVPVKVNEEIRKIRSADRIVRITASHLFFSSKFIISLSG